MLCVKPWSAARYCYDPWVPGPGGPVTCMGGLAAAGRVDTGEESWICCLLHPLHSKPTACSAMTGRLESSE